MPSLLMGVISWIVTRHYYKKSSVNAPEWARPLIERLPAAALSLQELTALFQEEINKGSIKPHPVFQYVACPNCKASLDTLDVKAYDDDVHTVLVMSCPNCGWSESAEV